MFTLPPPPPPFSMSTKCLASVSPHPRSQHGKGWSQVWSADDVVDIMLDRDICWAITVTNEFPIGDYLFTIYRQMPPSQKSYIFLLWFRADRYLLIKNWFHVVVSLMTIRSWLSPRTCCTTSCSWSTLLAWHSSCDQGTEVWWLWWSQGDHVKYIS